MKNLLYFYLDLGYNRTEVRAYPKSDAEVDCKCKSEICTHTLVAESTLKSVLDLREEHANTIVVTSWYRCNVHNAEVGGKLKSKHLLGLAVDLWSPVLDKLEEEARDYFDVVIRYDNFIHCHNEE